MKVFFNASFIGRKQFGRQYKRLRELLEEQGHEVVAAPVMDDELGKKMLDSPATASNYYEQVSGWIKRADVCVFETSFPTTLTGYEVALALNLSKPVVALHTKEAPGNRPLEIINDEKLQVVEYTEVNLNRVVETSLDYAGEQMDTRFNFFISPKIAAHLDDVSKSEKVPRAVYLRRLIEEDMERNGGYSEASE